MCCQLPIRQLPEQRHALVVCDVAQHAQALPGHGLHSGACEMASERCDASWAKSCKVKMGETEPLPTNVTQLATAAPAVAGIQCAYTHSLCPRAHRCLRAAQVAAAHIAAALQVVGRHRAALAAAQVLQLVALAGLPIGADMGHLHESRKSKTQQRARMVHCQTLPFPSIQHCPAT